MQYKLSQVLGIVKESIDELMGEFSFWCIADVVSIQTKGKFSYIELAELDEVGNIIAKTRANIRDKNIITAFTKVTGLSSDALKNQTILFCGHVSFHTTYGFSVVIDEISSDYTLGKIASSQKSIIDTLLKEGIINQNKICSLGLPPFSIAVISGHTSAGMEDFFAILRDAGIRYSVTQYPCAIQGNQAKADVSKQLEAIHKYGMEGGNYNIVCIMRGGGGVSDMLRQNDIDIARAICQMPIPILVAVGHTQDSSVLEQVARSHAKTPSEAAYLIIQEYVKYADNITNLYESICHRKELLVSSYSVDIPHIVDAISRLVQQKIDSIKKDVESIYASILAYHPKNILAQGYAVVLKEDMLINKERVETLRVDDSICVQIYDTTIRARIESIETRE